MPDVSNKLLERFMRFPGIGPRQARRFVQHLCMQNTQSLKELAGLIGTLSSTVAQCHNCFRFTETRHNGLCSLCANESRDQTLLMVVANDMDLEAVEKSNTYQGHYFVLGGLLSPLDKNPEQKVRLNELVARIKRATTTAVSMEIIFALGATSDGDHTTDFIKEILATIVPLNTVRISLLGRGLSTGTELEYSDPLTIKNALHSRV